MNGHEVTGRVVQRVVDDRLGVKAVCTCGWTGPDRYGAMSTRRAQDDARDHLDTAGEA